MRRFGRLLERSKIFRCKSLFLRRMSKSILREIGKRIYGEASSKIIRSMDVIGDIAIIKLPHELLDERRFIFGREVLKELKYINVVLRQRTPVEGLLRIRRFEHIAGENRTETIYKECGAIFRVDVERVYFSPRLSNERLRISKLVSDGETVVNMFAGVGPYSILIARKVDNAVIHSIDINPVAIEYHLANNILNKVTDKIITYRGDAKEIIIKYLSSTADRVLMPLPEYALQYLEYALHALKNKGYIHVYLHVKYGENREEALIRSQEIILRELGERGYRVVEIDSHPVREVATRLLQVCVDAYIRKI